MRPTRNSDKALLGLRLHREGLKTSTGSVACSGPGSRQKSGGGGAGKQFSPLKGMRVVVDQWVGPQGPLRWSAYPLAVLLRDHVQDPGLFLKWKLGVLSFGSQINAPTAHTYSCLVFLYSVAGGDVGPGASTAA